MKCPVGKCECVHYDNNNCKALGPWYALSSEMEQCPWPSKIQAPEKYPFGEFMEEAHKELYGENTKVHTFWNKFRDLAGKYWPKQGDVDKAWSYYWEHYSPGPKDSRKLFEKAIKEGGFPV